MRILAMPRSECLFTAKERNVVVVDCRCVGCLGIAASGDEPHRVHPVKNAFSGPDFRTGLYELCYCHQCHCPVFRDAHNAEASSRRHPEGSRSGAHLPNPSTTFYGLPHMPREPRDLRRYLGFRSDQLTSSPRAASDDMTRFGTWWLCSRTTGG